MILKFNIFNFVEKGLFKNRLLFELNGNKAGLYTACPKPSASSVTF